MPTNQSNLNTMRIPYCELYDYCREHIDDFYAKERIALTNIDKMRCDLQSAFPSFYNEMSDAIGEWIADHDFDESVMDDGNFVEDVFWEGCSAEQ